MSSLDDSNQIFGRVFARLLAKGLKKQDISCEDIWSDGDFPSYSEKEFLDLFPDVMTWMQDEGLIKFDDYYYADDLSSVFWRVQLTSKGLTIAKSELEKDDTTIEQTVESGELTPGAYTKIGALIGSALGGLMKSLS